MIRAKANAKGLQRQLARTEGATRAATRRTLNKVIAQCFTLTLRTVSKATGLTQKKLREYMHTDRADFGDLSASVQVFAHTFNVASFAGRQTKKGVSAAAWGMRKVYPGTFLVNGKTAMHRIGKSRYPIEPIWGPRITREYVRESTDEQLKALVASKYGPTMKHELDFALGRIGLKAE